MSWASSSVPMSWIVTSGPTIAWVRRPGTRAPSVPPTLTRATAARCEPRSSPRHRLRAASGSQCDRNATAWGSITASSSTAWASSQPPQRHRTASTTASTPAGWRPPAPPAGPLVNRNVSQGNDREHRPVDRRHRAARSPASSATCRSIPGRLHEGDDLPPLVPRQRRPPGDDEGQIGGECAEFCAASAADGRFLRGNAIRSNPTAPTEWVYSTPTIAVGFAFSPGNPHRRGNGVRPRATHFRH